MRILVVDDSRLIREKLKDDLESWEYEVILAVDGMEAMGILRRENSPRLVILDWDMPGLSGINICQFLKSRANGPFVYVIMLTTKSKKEDIVEALNAGAHDFLVKPFEPEEMRSRVNVGVRILEYEKNLIEKGDELGRLSQAVEQSPVTIMITDSDGRTEYANKKYTQLTGYTFEEAKGKIPEVFLAESANPVGKEKIIDTVRAGHDWRCEFFNKTKCGDGFWELATVSPLRNHKGDITHFLCIREDITERKKSESELEKHRRQLEELVVERTAELATIVDNLKHEITERQRAKKDLQESFELLQRSMNSTILAITKIVETRDAYTAGHQKRVSELACAIAVEMKLPEERIDGIRIAAIIHDIGKIYIPAEFLSKPGILSEAEFNVIKMHPKVSFDILKTIEFPWPIAQIVYQHHERMDGSGYPQGLTGYDILLEARIIAVADVVEAISSHRPYRIVLGIESALEEITMNKHVLYDPEVVDACMTLFSEKGFDF